MDPTKTISETVTREAPLEQEADSRYETDVTPWLDEIFNRLLGNSLVGGEWKRDQSLLRSMNEKGASAYIREITARVSTHMHFSQLKEEDVIEMASRSAENYADMIEDHWYEWDIDPTQSNFESISQSLYDALFTCLKIAENGGMKRHRERRRGVFDMPTPKPPAL